MLGCKNCCRNISGRYIQHSPQQITGNSRILCRCGLGVFVEGRVTHSDVYKSVTKQRAAIQHSDSTSSSCPATRLVLHPASAPTQ